MDTTALDQLIVTNLVDLDASAKRIAEIEKRVWRDIGDRVSTWAAAKGWRHDCEGDEVWVAPRDWFEGDEPFAWFSLDWGPDDDGEGEGDEPYFDLSRLAGAAGGRLCLWLEHAGVGGRSWKAAATPQIDAIKAAGFALTDKLNAYADCTPATAAIADGLADDNLDAALAPITVALDQAFAVWPLFDAILKTARA